MQAGCIGLPFAITHGRSTVVEHNAAQLAELNPEPEFPAARQHEQLAQCVEIQHPAQRRDHGKLRRKTRQQLFKHRLVQFQGQPFFDSYVSLDDFVKIFAVVGHGVLPI
jgi:hypothetical protein